MATDKAEEQRTFLKENTRYMVFELRFQNVNVLVAYINSLSVDYKQEICSEKTESEKMSKLLERVSAHTSMPGSTLFKDFIEAVCKERPQVFRKWRNESAFTELQLGTVCYPAKELNTVLEGEEAIDVLFEEFRRAETNPLLPGWSEFASKCLKWSDQKISEVASKALPGRKMNEIYKAWINEKPEEATVEKLLIYLGPRYPLRLLALQEKLGELFNVEIPDYYEKPDTHSGPTASHGVALNVVSFDKQGHRQMLDRIARKLTGDNWSSFAAFLNIESRDIDQAVYTSSYRRAMAVIENWMEGVPGGPVAEHLLYALKNLLPPKNSIIRDELVPMFPKLDCDKPGIQPPLQ